MAPSMTQASAGFRSGQHTLRAMEPLLSDFCEAHSRYSNDQAVRTDRENQFPAKKSTTSLGPGASSRPCRTLHCQ